MSQFSLFGITIGRSRAKLTLETAVKANLQSIASAREAQLELQKLAAYLQQPEESVPESCILLGSQGIDKSAVARALAGEASVPLFRISGIDLDLHSNSKSAPDMVSSLIRDLFTQARKRTPCVVMIDKLEALGAPNTSPKKQIFLELGKKGSKSMIVIATVDQQEQLDPDFMRRFSHGFRLQLNDEGDAGKTSLVVYPWDLDTDCR